MRSLSVAVMTGLLMMLTSCADDQTLSSGGKGAAAGAAGGAVFGQVMAKNTQATIAGAAVGTLIGYMVGKEMDQTDTQKLNNALENGAAGNPISWKNPDTGDAYKIIPFEFFTDDATQKKCRKAKLVGNFDGKEQITDTKACRESDGHWVLDTVK